MTVNSDVYLFNGEQLKLYNLVDSDPTVILAALAECPFPLHATTLVNSASYPMGLTNE